MIFVTITLINESFQLLKTILQKVNVTAISDNLLVLFVYIKRLFY